MTRSNSSEILREPSPHFGMRLTQLSDEILHGVVSTYFEVVKGGPIEEYQLLGSYEASSVIEKGGAEFRLGSRLNQHSKLYIYGETGGLVSFRFYANHQKQEDEYPTSPKWHEAKAIDEEFRSRVDELLLVTGLAEPLST